MKKILLITILALTSLIAKSEVYQFISTQSNACVNNKWIGWKYSNIPIIIDTDDNIIVIYSNTPQAFQVTSSDYSFKYDNNGGKYIKMYGYDNDGVRCTFRFRYDNNNNPQLYIDYANLILLYSL